MASATLDEVVELVNHLTTQEQIELTAYLLKRAQERPLTAEEKMKLFHASILDVDVNEAPSVRREDWYDDDGR